MTFAWAFPLGLIGLAALLVPLLLHLDRRRTLRTLAFAAMQWIDRPSRPRRTWRLTEWLLLVLRLLLLVALAVWLAHPSLQGAAHDAQRVLAVVPGAVEADITAAAASADRIVWLADGLPPRAPAAAPVAGGSASLLRELDASLAPGDVLHVLVPRELAGLDASAIVLSRAVSWTESGTSTPTRVDAARPSPRNLVVRYEAGGDATLRYIEAAANAWNTNEATAVVVDAGVAGAALPALADAIVWIGATPDADAAARVADGARLLQIPVASPQDAGATADAWPPTFIRAGRGTRAELATPLEPRYIDALQSADFPARLRHALFPDETRPPTRAFATDVQPMQSHTLLSARPAESLRPWLAWCIAILFLLERLLATARRLARIA